MADSTKAKRRTNLPPKPYSDFPLTPMGNGYWCKKIKGKIHYFGRWGRTINGKLERFEDDGWSAAHELYKAQAADLHAGRVPEKDTLSPTVADLVNRFMNAKKRQLDQGMLAPRSFQEYFNTCERLFKELGKHKLLSELAPDDFGRLKDTISRTWGPVRIGNEVQRVRTVFKFAYEAELIKVPQRFGPEFKKPSATVIRKHRAQKPKRLFHREEIGELISNSKPHLKAMILLGINCGFGNTDCASLTIESVNFEMKMIDFPRPKTGIPRRCPLWPETIAALQESLSKRPSPKADEDQELFFITKYGKGWLSENRDAVYLEFGKVLKGLEFNRVGVGFYGLRHTFRTVADGCKDFPAIRMIMGHVDSSIDGVYRETIDDHRLIDASNHVRAWLFNGPLR